jgi:hypothetical protein
LIGQTNNLPAVREEVKPQNIFDWAVFLLLIMQRRLIIGFYTIDWVPQPEIPNSTILEAGTVDKTVFLSRIPHLHVNIQLQRHLIDNRLPCNLSSYNTVHPTILPPGCRALKTPQSQFSIPLNPNPESQFPSRPHEPRATAPKNALPMHIPLKS